MNISNIKKIIYYSLGTKSSIWCAYIALDDNTITKITDKNELYSILKRKYNTLNTNGDVIKTLKENGILELRTDDPITDIEYIYEDEKLVEIFITKLSNPNNKIKVKTLDRLFLENKLKDSPIVNRKYTYLKKEGKIKNLKVRKRLLSLFLAYTLFVTGKSFVLDNRINLNKKTSVENTIIKDELESKIQIEDETTSIPTKLVEVTSLPTPSPTKTVEVTNTPTISPTNTVKITNTPTNTIPVEVTNTPTVRTENKISSKINFFNTLANGIIIESHEDTKIDVNNLIKNNYAVTTFKEAKLIPYNKNTYNDKVDNIYYWTPDGKLVVRYNQDKNAFYSKNYKGFSYRNSGCGVGALAACLTQVLTDINGGRGHEVIVTPHTLLNAIDKYDTISAYYVGGMKKEYDNFGIFLSKVFGVHVISTNGGNIKTSEIVNILSKTNSSLLYSYKDKSHIGAVVATNGSNLFYVSDTKGKYGKYITGFSKSNYPGAKRWLVVSDDSIYLDDKILHFDSEYRFTKENNPLGTGTIIYSEDGINYELYKVENDDNTFSYHIK